MTGTFTKLAAAALLACCSTLVGCGGTDGETNPGGAAATTDPSIPDSYRYLLKSSCGERSLIGTYRVTVRENVVTEAQPIKGPELEVDQFPTLRDLLDKADLAGPDAVVDLEVDDKGFPVSVSIDHEPNAIDDEECYEVSDVAALVGY